MISKRVLVVGGTGFIGFHLLQALVKLGWSVTCLSLTPPKDEFQQQKVKYIYCDISVRENLCGVLKPNFDYIVNLGGYIDHKHFSVGGRAVIDTHFIGLINLVEISQSEKLKRFIQIGSSDEYGNVKSPQREEAREEPISPYSAAKVSATHFLQMLYRTEKFPATILRLFLTFGPGQKLNRLLPQLIKGCLQNKEIPMSLGKQIRDFCYVEDVVKAIIKALQNDKINGHIINIASGNPISVENITKLVVSRVGGGKPKFGELSYRPGENMSLYASTEKAQDILNWRPQVSLEQGIDKTIDWVKKNI